MGGLHDRSFAAKPAVLVKPLAAAAAVEVVQANSFGRRRVYDARLALALRRQGITEFATANVKDFTGFGFDRVWNPVAA